MSKFNVGEQDEGLTWEYTVNPNKEGRIQFMTSQIKEIKAMRAEKILDIYFNRQRQKILNEHQDKKRAITENDKIYQLLEDTENQINIMLDRDDKNRFLLPKRILQTETEEELELLLEQYTDKLGKLGVIRDEIEALLDIIPEGENEYCDIVELLQTYEILDEDGKINQ